MQFRRLGRTGLNLSTLSFGASSLGQEFRQVDVQEALRSVRVALELGMNFIDTSPFYGRGMSECLLGVALRDVPRDSYYLGSKLYIWKKAEEHPEQRSSDTELKNYASVMVPKISDSKLKDLTWSLDIKESMYSNRNQK